MNKYINIIALAVFFLTSCSNNTYKDKKSLDNISEVKYETNINEKYIKDETLKLELNSPQSMVQLEDKIIITDTDNDRVVISNNEGKIIQIIGETGNKKGEFIKPTAVGIGNNNEIIVGDSGNGRIQVFNKEGIFIKKIIINKFNNNPFNIFKSIVVDINNNIYISTETPDEKFLGVYIISPNDKIMKVADGFWGKLFSNGKNVYLVTEGEWNKDEQAFYSGTSYVFQIGSDKKIKPVLELPVNYSPRAIIQQGNDIIVYSHGYATIDRFDFRWNYIETVVKESFSTTSGWKDIIEDKDGNIYILNDLESYIIKYKKRVDE